MSLLIPEAFAQTTGEAVQAGGGGAFGSILILVVFVLIFYFLLWRPQSKRGKEHRELVSKLATGDEIVTSGGMVGKITKISDDFITLNIAEGVEISVQKGSVSKTLPKGSMRTL